MPEHLFVKLFDAVTDASPTVEFNDEDDDVFYDLRTRNFAGKAARVDLVKGSDYRVGDHVQLLDAATETGSANTVCADPDVNMSVNLNNVLNGAGFADRAAAAKIILNPNADGSYRLRVNLYDTVGQPDDCPSLILYDWEFAMKGNLADLNRSCFADKAAKVIVDAGPGLQPGDFVNLRDQVGASAGVRVEPGRSVNLNDYKVADKAAAVSFFAP